VPPSPSTESIVSLLWRHRWWIAPGLVAAVVAVVLSTHTLSLSPPSLKRDSAEFAAASTQVLVDFPQRSSILDLESTLDPLVDRANVYSRLAPSPAVLELIARKAGIDATLIDAKGPYKPGSPRLEREPSAERRASQLRAEREQYRLRFDSERDQNIPIVNIYAQAPTVAEADRLANSAATGMQEYVARIQREEGLTPEETVRLRALGRANGGVVNPGVDRQIAVLTFMGTLVAWSLIVLLVSGLWRYGRARSAPPEHEEFDHWEELFDVDRPPSTPMVGSRR
jgi:uncharacterized protein involved in exopolysaccharide biosynthesis